MNKIIEIKCATVELLSDDLIYITYVKDYNVELADVIELDNALKEKLGDKKVHVISDFSNQYNNFTKEAQLFLAKEGEIVKHILSSSIIINSLSTRLLARFFISFHKPKYPVKIFTNVDEATDWINELRQGQKKVVS